MASPILPPSPEPGKVTLDFDNDRLIVRNGVRLGDKYFDIHIESKGGALFDVSSLTGDQELPRNISQLIDACLQAVRAPGTEYAKLSPEEITFTWTRQADGTTSTKVEQVAKKTDLVARSILKEIGKDVKFLHAITIERGNVAEGITSLNQAMDVLVAWLHPDRQRSQPLASVPEPENEVEMTVKLVRHYEIPKIREHFGSMETRDAWAQFDALNRLFNKKGLVDNPLFKAIFADYMHIRDQKLQELFFKTPNLELKKAEEIARTEALSAVFGEISKFFETESLRDQTISQVQKKFETFLEKYENYEELPTPHKIGYEFNLDGVEGKEKKEVEQEYLRIIEDLNKDRMSGTCIFYRSEAEIRRAFAEFANLRHADKTKISPDLNDIYLFIRDCEAFENRLITPENDQKISLEITLGVVLQRIAAPLFPGNRGMIQQIQEKFQQLYLRLYE